jgi:hypothetical protein
LADTAIASAAELSDAIADAYFQYASRSCTGGSRLWRRDGIFNRHRTTYRHLQDVSHSGIWRICGLPHAGSDRV